MRTLLEDSASGVVSEGPVLQVPAEIERIQFTSLLFTLSAHLLDQTTGKQLTSVAVVPDIVSGSQTYVDAAKSVDNQRSPMYLCLSAALST